ncbi:hypothetical protein SEPCBS57363_000358 [Sporothrix epigloea]|uniref:Something about silencing protein 4 domain-containing protein n=1 Tax=Sporothrix epigloea TaxID=1892477 RepID=A0ABP0D7X2_9PEZI
MLETLTILPMAPGSRSRQVDVLHRATPVLLPKPKQRQTTLDEHLRSMAARPNVAATRPPPLQPALSRGLQQSQQSLQQSQPQKSLQPAQQQQKQRQRQSQQSQPQSQSRQQPFCQQRQLVLAPADQTRSSQNILNNADSMGPMSAARPKRKIATNANATAETNDHTSDSDSRIGSRLRKGNSSELIQARGGSDETDANDSTRGAASRKRQRLAIEIVDFANSCGSLQVVAGAAPVPQAATALSPPKLRTATKTKPNSTTRSLAAVPIAVPTPTHAISTTSEPISTANTNTKAAAATNSSEAAVSSPAPSRSLRPVEHLPAEPVSQSAIKSTKETAANAGKQELKSLQVSTEDAEAVAKGSREGGRKLRSQEASRFKSDLAAYFPDYDEVIGNEPKEEHLLNIDTPIVFVESSVAHPATTTPFSSSLPSLSASLATSLRNSDRVSSMRVKSYGDRLFYDVFDSHVLDFTFLGNQHKGKGAVDPLPDSYYKVHHKRAERLERSIRNTEKGRAKHEKNQIIRLLDGLQGPDWLRIMGVSGITESKKKTFEPAREHFIRGCRAILEKFRLWSVEEKRRKQEKDREHAEATALIGAASRAKKIAKTDTTAHKARGRPPSKATGRGTVKRVTYENNAMAERDEEDSNAASNGAEEDGDLAADEEVDDDSLPDSSDFDAVITQQLREEALGRSRLASKAADSTRKRRNPSRTTKRHPRDASTAPEDTSSLSQPQEVTSFFQKRYQRDAAVARDRRRGRTVMAWGQPVPDVPETEFQLPGDFLEDKATTESTTSRRGRRGGWGGTRRGGRRQ